MEFINIRGTSLKPEWVKKPKKATSTDRRDDDVEEEAKVRGVVAGIIDSVAKNGDAAIAELSLKFDKYQPSEFTTIGEGVSAFRLSEDAIAKAIASVPADIMEAIKYAQQNVLTFAKAQRETIKDLEVEMDHPKGVVLGHKHVPMSRIGAYVPGGRYPIIASAQMSIIPAKVAGVKTVVACTPPKDGGIPETTVAAMSLAGADEIYIVGGVQAIAMMALGTETVEPVDFLVGPGNPFVAEAKRQLFGRVGIDLIAGPTETLVVADEHGADAEICAADLIGQAEHGPTSACVMITSSRKLAEDTLVEIEKLLKWLPTAPVAEISWRDYGEILLVENIAEMSELADIVASEHVQIMTKDDEYFLKNMKHYGALFLGKETNVSYGDKCIGTNHILPTKWAARYTGGVWCGKFLKTLTYQRVTTTEGSVELGRVCSKMCEAEGMMGHKEQADLRVRRWGNL